MVDGKVVECHLAVVEFGAYGIREPSVAQSGVGMDC